VVQQLAETELGLDAFTASWYRVISKTRETPDTLTIRARPINGQALSFKPGQFNMLYAYGTPSGPSGPARRPSPARGVAST